MVGRGVLAVARSVKVEAVDMGLEVHRENLRGQVKEGVGWNRREETVEAEAEATAEEGTKTTMTREERAKIPIHLSDPIATEEVEAEDVVTMATAVAVMEGDLEIEVVGVVVVVAVATMIGEVGDVARAMVDTMVEEGIVVLRTIITMMTSMLEIVTIIRAMQGQKERWREREKAKEKREKGDEKVIQTREMEKVNERERERGCGGGLKNIVNE